MRESRLLKRKVVVVWLWYEGTDKERLISVCEWRGWTVINIDGEGEWSKILLLMHATVDVINSG
jgi:hypothetical protein